MRMRRHEPEPRRPRGCGDGRALVALLVLGGLAVAVPGRAAPRAGTVIQNVAVAQFRDADSGVPVSLRSNVVEVSVAPVEGIDLADDRTLAVLAGSVVSFAHILTNTGNVETRYTLAFANLGGDDFELSNVALVLDANGNGLADPGETELGDGATLTLAPGAAAALVLSGVVPGTVLAGQDARLTLSATGSSPAVTDANTDTARVAAAAVLAVSKSGVPAQAGPAQLLTFTLATTNRTATPAQGIPVTIDGVATDRVVVADAIPARTRFVEVASAGRATPLYHVAGDATGAYRSAPPASPADVDEVAFALPVLAGGASFSAQLRVRVDPDATSGSVSNTAEVRYGDGVRPGPTTRPSNAVEIPLVATAPTIAFFTDDGFERVALVSGLGEPLYVAAEATSCDLDAGLVEVRSIRLVSALSGDIESFAGTETGPASGVFRILPAVPTADAETVAPAAGDGVLQVARDDTVAASITDCVAGAVVEARVRIDPGGVVFDSRSNVPVAGAQVTLIDVTGAGNGDPGGPARVLLADGVTPAPSSVTTGSDGRFDFPLLAPSTYRLVVVPPASFTFPSALAPAEQPPGRKVLADASYGASFPIGPDPAPVALDVPLDAEAAPTDGPSGLGIEKEPSRDVVSIGEFVDYRIEVHNELERPAEGVVVDDALPAGFRYEGGTARLDGRALGNPAGGGGPNLRFALGTIDAGASVALRYRALVGPGARDGNGRNVAVAYSSREPAIRSSRVTAQVRIEDDVFTERGYLLGKVFADCDEDRVQDVGEPGVPGIGLVLEDGTGAVTDGQGSYSFYGLRARTHVLKLDASTLPAGGRLERLENRFAGDAGSRFVDLKKGELHRGDFALAGCPPALLAAVAERRAAAAAAADELDASLENELETRPTESADESVKARPAAGVVDRSGRSGFFEPLALPNAGLDTGNSNLPAAPVRPVPHAPLDSLLPALDAALGFVGLADGATLPGRIANVRVKGPLGARFALAVGDRTVPESRVGQRASMPSSGVEAWEFVGVAFEPGPNDLTLTGLDAFGNRRGSVAIRVVAPGALARLRLELPAEGIAADPQTPVPVIVHVEDANGVPVTARTPVTLEASDGSFEGRDLDATEPGLQVFAEDGRAEVRYAPPGEPGEGRLRASSGELETERLVAFAPHLRPLIAAGLVEGIAAASRKAADDLEPSRSEPDGFEDEINDLLSAGDGGRGRLGLRGALYARGRIRGDALLTLRYDSEKDPDTRLFRDIEPDRFYPIYGDASERRYEAQSTSTLYARIDKDRSFLLYGDYTTLEFDDAINLGAYTRALTGAKGRFENGRIRLDAFASQDDTRQVVQELRGRGISGPYELDFQDVVEQSEVVEILVRDRDQPSLVLETTPLIRFLDYEIDALSGTLLLREPVPSFDANLNPVSIRVAYEVEQGASSFWVAGVGGRVKPLSWLQLGARYVEDNSPEDGLELASAHVALDLPYEARLIGEVAQTNRVDGRGQAARIDLRRTGPRLDAWAYWAWTDSRFDNPSSTYLGGRLEAGLRGSYRIRSGTRLFAQAIQTQDQLTDGRRRGAELYVEQLLNRWLTGELGLRYVHETGDPASADTALVPEVTPFSYTSARAKLTAQVPFFPALSLFGEFEQSLASLGEQVASAGGELQVANRTRLYARHEFISSLGSPYALNPEQDRHATLFGIESDHLRGTSVYSEYRVDDAIAGRDAEAAIGLRNRWHLAPGLSLLTAVERIQTVTGPGEDDATAASLGLAYTASPRWKTSGRAEYRTSGTQNSFLNTLGFASKLDESWSLLGRSLVYVDDSQRDDAGDELLARTQIGLAFRPPDHDRWNALARYEFKYEKDRDDDFDRRRSVHVVSVHLDYRPLPRLHTNGQYAFKWADERTGSGPSSQGLTQLLAGRLTFDLAERWDVGVLGSGLWSGGFDQAQYGVGAEVGYLVMKNLWVSAGYNFFGFEDDDLTEGAYTNPGAYVRFRFKFDESALGWLSP